MLAKQGWKFPEKQNKITGNIKGILDKEYSLDWERFVAMEALFNEKYFENKGKKTLPDAVVEFVAKHPKINQITFMGGIVACPGFFERIQLELKELKDIKINVDENLMWKCTV